MCWMLITTNSFKLLSSQQFSPTPVPNCSFEREMRRRSLQALGFGFWDARQRAANQKKVSF